MADALLPAMSRRTVTGQIDDLPPAAERLARIADDARVVLERNRQ